MNRNKLVIYAVIGVVLMWAVVLVTNGGRTSPLIPEGVRGKSPALPLSDITTPEEILAQDLALSDPRVQDLTVGKKSEVMDIKEVGLHYPTGAEVCSQTDCRQIEIYLWAEDTNISVIVDVNSREVVAVLEQPGIHPMINTRLRDRAIEIIYNAPEVAETLGFQPNREDIAPMDGNLLDSSCAHTHVCAAATFRAGDRFMWAFADLTTDSFAGIGWTPAPENDGSSMLFTPEGCPVSGSVNRAGWVLQHDVTNNDGLRVFNVSYNGQQVFTSVKLVEWHADYGSSGYQDSTGCSSGGGGFTIYPYGETEVLDLLDAQNNVIGFEVVQDFRMGNWGNSCNYRYEQRIQFFNDGRFRTVSGAYGKGCGTNAMYRPVVRLNIAINDEANDNFAYWNGTDWTQLTTEDYRVPYTETGHGPHQADANGYAWKVYDASGAGYYLEMDIGQWDGDFGLGDSPFVYATQHHANEGDSDLYVFSSGCCNDNHMQGPHLYLNNESVANQNIVLWYVPQSLTDASAPTYYCWTLQGEPNPVTYPCFSGPMFHPISTTPMGIASGAVSLQGRSDFSGAEITATDQALNTYITSTDGAGNFSFDLPPGTYSFKLEMDGYLDAEISGIEVVTNTTSSLPPITLLGGDTNDSDKINILDLVFIGSHYGIVCATQGWDSRADVNADCVINIQDLTIASGNFNKSSPIPWE